MLVAKKNSSSGLHYLHTDLLGSPIKGKVGSISYTEHYSPWGEKKNDPIQLADDVGYMGHQSDTATGLTYMQARYYDPVAGRFMAVDPVAFTPDNPMSFNRYSYVNNNPFKYNDPTGEVADTVADVGFVVYDLGKVIAGIAAYTVGAATGNEALQNAAVEGLEETRGDLIGDTAALAVPLLPAGTTRAARKLDDVAESASATRRSNIEAGIPESQLGPSGRPKQHTVRHSQRKGAREAAERETPRGGRTRHDATPGNEKQGPDFQAEDARGDNVHPTVHHEYPKSKR